ncbi:hypothetical protein BV25DRAFT_1831937 [Artomyces pyxidatus]|uniref:Uncharacterized protein n=1 Tax=Artomyces pyxidatus TaxID=48021 RepID=A0ACB8SK15_9AGAM|nr:hypothetical protein BV25DRAFT_1831937 [Artomyces pyxidatus]
MASPTSNEFWAATFRARLSTLYPIHAHHAIPPGITPQTAEDETDAIKRVLADASAWRNSLVAPIMRLPPEIMSMIFEEYSSSELSPFRTWTTHAEYVRFRDYPKLIFGRQQLGWINVTHVCRRWREIALSTGTLWSVIDNSTIPRPFLDEILRRSLRSPLHFKIYTHCLKGNLLEDLENLIGADIGPRVQKLELYLSSVSPEASARRQEETRCLPLFLEYLWTQSTRVPRLESLTMEDYTESTSFLIRLKTENMPLLRSLTLDGPRLWTSSTVLHHMVHLDLGLYPDSPVHLHEIFQELRVVETINVVLIIDHSEWPSETAHSFSPVVLPRLTSLDFSALHISFLDLANILVVPATAHIKLHSLVRPTLPVSPFMHPIIRNFGGAARRPLALVFTTLPNTGLVLNLWVKALDWNRVWSASEEHIGCENSDGVQFAGDLPNFKLTFEEDSPELPPISRRTVPWQGLCLTELRDLAIQTEFAHVWTKHRWLATFREANKVTTLVARGTRAAISLLNALASPTIGKDVPPPSIQSDASLLPFLVVSEAQRACLGTSIADAQWDAAEPDALLFPQLDTIILRHLSVVYDEDRKVLANSDAFAILEALCERLEARRKQGAASVNLVEIPCFDDDQSRIAAVVDRLKAQAGVEAVRVVKIQLPAVYRYSEA